MGKSRALLFFVFFIAFSFVASQSNPCSSLKSPNGKYSYDLSWFAQQPTKLAKGTTGGDSYQYEFQICGSGFSCGVVACKASNAGACQSWDDFMTSGSQACLGTSTPTNVTALDDGQGVEFTYLNGDAYRAVSRVTYVKLKCDKGKDWGTVVFDDSQQANLRFSITILTSRACGVTGGASGLSPGSVILIFLLIVVVLYLVGGVLFNKFKKQATGVEVLPNVGFWKSFFGSVKDGALWIKNRGNYTPV
eukprot:TRINITY_DN5309_c0_g1_i1.p1 TRINITY_DN5309_c0_g1~~TRINITY_DN5309_c0_g1_i1.p1  ORF type:complete len:274 (+),score=45.23 TRINITY_DN5309_c0_g1_i1:81-824(+)